MILQRSSYTNGRQPSVVVTRDPRIDPPSSLSSSQWVNDDGNWMITLCDLTFLLIGFLVMWYVTNKEAASGSARFKPKPIARKLIVAPSGTSFVPPQGWELLRNEIADYLTSLELTSDVDLESGKSEVVLSLRTQSPSIPAKRICVTGLSRSWKRLQQLRLPRAGFRSKSAGIPTTVRSRHRSFHPTGNFRAARASRVARYLIERGVHPSRISVRGFASQRPRISNTAGSRRGVNRRVEIRLGPGTDVVTDFSEGPTGTWSHLLVPRCSPLI